jgi:transposase
MAKDRKIDVPSDEVWQQLEPLIEAARPPHRTGHVDLRQTIEAIIWRHQNGARWRAIPPDLGRGGVPRRPSSAGAASASSTPRH